MRIDNITQAFGGTSGYLVLIDPFLQIHFPPVLLSVHVECIRVLLILFILKIACVLIRFEIQIEVQWAVTPWWTYSSCKCNCRKYNSYKYIWCKCKAEFRFPGPRKGNWGDKLVPETTQQYGGLLEVKIIVKTSNREIWVYIMNHNEDMFVTSARVGLRLPFGCLCYPGVACNNTPELQGRRRVF